MSTPSTAKREADKERKRKRYQYCVANRLCVRCESPLSDGRRQRSCEMCAEWFSALSGRWQQTARGRASIRKRHRTERYKVQRRAYQRSVARKRASEGLCKCCNQPRLKDSIYCHSHREYHRAKDRDYLQRRREAKQAGVRLKRKKPGRTRKRRDERLVIALPVVRVPQAPSLDPVYDYRAGEMTLQAACVRYVELHGGITCREVGDAFNVGHMERDRITHALIRAVKNGRLRIEQERFARPWERTYHPVRAHARRAA